MAGELIPMVLFVVIGFITIGFFYFNSKNRQSIEAEILTEKLMSLVSEEERACLTLAYAAGMSHAEVCNITRLPLGTVKSHINRGKQKLQR